MAEASPRTGTMREDGGRIRAPRGEDPPDRADKDDERVSPPERTDLDAVREWPEPEATGAL